MKSCARFQLFFGDNNSQITDGSGSLVDAVVFYQVLGDFNDEWLMDPQTRPLVFHLFLSGHCR